MNEGKRIDMKMSEGKRIGMITNITNAEFEPFYNSASELVKLINNRSIAGFRKIIDDKLSDEITNKCSLDIVHIYFSALNLITALELHMSSLGAGIYFLNDEDGYKYLLPLLTISEKEMLADLVKLGGNKDLISKFEDAELVYDISKTIN